MLVRNAIFSLSADASLWEKMVSWYQQSFLHELITSIQTQFFNVEFGVYENFSFSEQAESTAETLIVGIAIGLIIAAAFMSFTRTRIGRFVRKMIKEECFSAESSKTLTELEEFRNSTVRRQLAKGMILRNIVRCVEEDDAKAAGAEYQFDFKTAHFYIPEEQKYRADVRFEKKGIGWLTVLLTAVCAVVAASLLCTFLPDIVRLMDNLILFFTQ
ncbi:MAG: hypothetical protein IJY42_05395 [Clostridia bacterium]|nr:hypothetical protein [Clostridia bacterium]MBQ8416334.1 hypothetical protein [Clostridia bacterium]